MEPANPVTRNRAKRERDLEVKVKYLLIISAMVIVTIFIVTFFSTNNSGKGPQFLYNINGDSDHALKEPVFAVASPAGDVYVSDAGNHLVRVFSKKGRFLYEFGGRGSKKVLEYPYGIGFLKDGVIVADTAAGALYEFNDRGEYIKTWLGPEAKAQPAGVFVAEDDNVYVTDLAANQILVFSDEGKLQRKIQPREVSLNSPQGLAVNKDGTVWVADGGNYNIKLIKPNGEVKTVFDGGPKWALTMAKGLAVDKKGRIYVADTLSNVIRVFDKDSSDLTSFGPVNDKESVFKFPVGLFVDSSGQIYIADQGNNQVQVWEWK